MSIHSVSAALSRRGIGHSVVASVEVEDTSIGLEVAVAAGRIADFDGLVKELESPEDISYAKRYRSWVKKGRTGSAPKSKGNLRTAKFIRSVTHTVGV